MSAQQPPSAAGGAPAAASGDAGGDADAAQAPVYDEALHREAFQAKVQEKFDNSRMVERQSLTSAEVELLINLVDGWHDKPPKQRGAHHIGTGKAAQSASPAHCGKGGGSGSRHSWRPRGKATRSGVARRRTTLVRCCSA